MTAPRLEVDLEKIEHNAHALVVKLARRGISVTAVTKATLGAPEIVEALCRAGVTAFADSRIENIETLREAGTSTTMTLLRTPMLSQVQRVVKSADVSCNTEIDVIRELSLESGRTGRTHGIILMVELGDLREGIMPGDLKRIARDTLKLPNLVLAGIGANLACCSGIVPDDRNMSELSILADSIDDTFGGTLDIVTGGNSANLQWALDSPDTGRINDLRLGESILLGREPLHRQPIDGLHTDAITLVAEVIESKMKPSLPWGEVAQAAFGEPTPQTDRGEVARTIFAVGRQDIDPLGLVPPDGIDLLGASSDHLITNSGSKRLAIGTERTFQVNYSALVRAMTSPFVSKAFIAADYKKPAPSIPGQ